jgi:hypothetical protein
MLADAGSSDKHVALQRQLRARPIHFQDNHDKQDVIVLPVLAFDQQELQKVKGVTHYEERQLFHLLLLARPGTRLFFVSSRHVQNEVINYYLSLVGEPNELRKRLHTLSVDDDGPRTLTQKLLGRPDLLARLKATIDPGRTHISPFNVTEAEVRLAVTLGVPLWGTSPELGYLGSKAGSRLVFAASGVPYPEGSGELRNERELIDAIERFVENRPGVRRLIVKLNEGFSGEGNAVIDIGDLAAIDRDMRRSAIAKRLGEMRFVARGETWDRYRKQIHKLGAVVERFIEGEKRSPSVQGMIGPDKTVKILSTYEQILDGNSGQKYLGGRCPADGAYRSILHEAGQQVGQVLARKGALGRFSVDFVASRPEHGSNSDDRDWTLHAIEINLRAGGTTHPAGTVKLLLDGDYELRSGAILAHREGSRRYHISNDNLDLEVGEDRLRGTQPLELIQLAQRSALGYRHDIQEGVVLHMLGAVTRHGKLGLTAIGRTPQRAGAIFRSFIDVLQQYRA